MADLYAEPPHLTVSVYSDQDERETFAQLCALLPQFKCTPTYKIEIASARLEFEMISDLGGNREIITASPDRYNRLIAALEPDIRALRAGYSHRKYGSVVVEYETREEQGTHPVGVSLSAGDLGIPGSLWSAKQRRAAYGIAEWSLSFLNSAAHICKPLYGAIGVEYSLPTPGKLICSKSGIPTEWFVSRVLLNHDPSLEGKLRAIYVGGEVSNWDEGIFCSGWAPYNSERLTVSRPSEVARNSAEALGSTLTNFRRGRAGS